MPISSSASNSGSTTGCGCGPCLRQFSRATMRRPMRMRVGFVDGEVVGQTRDAGVHFGAAERFVVGLLAGGHLHQRRAGQEHLRAFLDHHHVIGHAGDVGAAGGGVAEHQRDRRDARRRQPGQVAEHPPAGDEDLLLRGQVRAAGFHQRDHRQPVLQGDLVGPQDLPQRPRVAGAALDGRVVGDDHALDALDDADAGDHAGADLEVAAPRGQRAQLQERRVRVDAAVRCAPARSACRGRGAARRTWARRRPSALASSASISASLSVMRRRRLGVGGGRRVEGGLAGRS